jgi:tRNA pseudouridine65 synthase
MVFPKNLWRACGAMAATVSPALEVLYRDEQLLVVAKPAGLIVHPGWGNDRDTALSRARRLAGRWVYPAHRLDRATSGVLVFALDPASSQRLGAAIREQQWSKSYLALVRGKPPASGLIDSPVPRSEDGERVAAQTRFTCLGSSSVERCSLVCAQPITGRMHQIRRHLKHISHPLIGDVRYGKGPINRHYRATYGFERMALHACALRLPHPTTGEWLEVRAPVAPELAACFTALGFEPSTWEPAFSLPPPEQPRPPELALEPALSEAELSRMELSE